jgi:hypothetical protein
VSGQDVLLAFKNKLDLREYEAKNRISLNTKSKSSSSCMFWVFFTLDVGNMWRPSFCRGGAYIETKGQPIVNDKF